MAIEQGLLQQFARELVTRSEKNPDGLKEGELEALRAFEKDLDLLVARYNSIFVFTPPSSLYNCDLAQIASTMPCACANAIELESHGATKSSSQA